MTYLPGPPGAPQPWGPAQQWPAGSPTQTGQPKPKPRIPQAIQGLINFLLVLPSAAVFYVISDHFNVHAWRNWSLVVGLYVYAIVILGIAGRSITRRIVAVVIVLLATVVVLMPNFLNIRGANFYMLLNTATGLSILMGAIAWSIARRQHALWIAGIVPATIIVAGLIIFCNDPDTPQLTWFEYWLVYAGALVGCCLSFWAFDGVGRLITLATRKNNPSPTPGSPGSLSYPGPSYPTSPGFPGHGYPGFPPGPS